MRRKSFPAWEPIPRAVILLAILLFCLMAMLSGCQSPNPSQGPTLFDERPPCTWKLWAADSVTGGIKREQEKLSISAKDVAFNNYICLSSEDFENLLTCGGPAPVATPAPTPSPGAAK